MLLRGPTLADGSRVDVVVDGERIATVAEAESTSPRRGEAEVDLSDYVLLPAPAEPHAHLDKAYTADRLPSAGTDLLGAVATWHEYRRTLPAEDIAKRARRAALDALRRGATAIRTHVDVGEGIELRAVEALIGLREQLRGLLELQVVALAYPLTGAGSEENRELLRRSLELGVDVVGGAPHIDPDPVGHMEVCLSTALEFGRQVDLHVDEHTRESVDLAALARLARDFPHGVTASHCVSLSLRPLEVQREVAEAVAASGVGIVALPLTNLYLQGREYAQATPRGMAPIRTLLATGVTVAAGGDNVQDPFNPLGAGDPLQTAQLLVAGAHIEPHAAFELVSDGARAVMGVPAARIEEGASADFLAVRASSLREAVATATEDRLVVLRGRVVARTRVQRER